VEIIKHIISFHVQHLKKIEVPECSCIEISRWTPWTAPAPPRQKDKESKTNNYIVPFRTEAFNCSVLSYISQHRIESRCSDVQSINYMHLLIAIMFLRKSKNFFFSKHRNGSRCFKMEIAFCKNKIRYA